MKEQNVDDDRCEKRQREWNVAIEQKKSGADQLDQEYHDEKMGNEQCSHELTGHAGRRRRRDEVEESVQSKDQEDQAEKQTGDDRSNFNGNVLLFDLNYIDINIIKVNK